MGKKLGLLTTAILVVAGCMMCQSQNQEAFERTRLFDYDWKFALGDFPAASEINFDDSNWRILNLPHDWSIEGETNPQHPTGGAGGYFPAGVGWYRNTFKIPPTWQGKRVSIYFGGVYMNAEVFINGQSLGVHSYGYTSFVHDLTPFLNFNQNNSIAVRVDNSQQQNCHWYSGSGIYRHVWIIVTDPVHIAHWGTAITTHRVSDNEATVELKTLVKNETDVPQQIEVSTILLDKNTASAGDDRVQIELQAQSDKEIVQSVAVKNPLLWSPETPIYIRHKQGFCKVIKPST